MMVLRHVGRPSATVVRHMSGEDEDEDSSPIDLSNKHSPSPPSPPEEHRSRSSGSLSYSKVGGIGHARGQPMNPTSFSRSSRTSPNLDLAAHGSHHSLRGWMRSGPLSLNGEIPTDNEDGTSYSSPDSGLHRDSPGEGEDEETMSGKPGSSSPIDPHHPINSRTQNLIPLSLIRARFSPGAGSRSGRVVVGGGPGSGSGTGTDEDSRVSHNHHNKSDPPDPVKSKRARLEEMVSHIKQSKPSSKGRVSGDEDTSSRGTPTSSDEVGDEIPKDLRRSNGGGGGGRPSIFSRNPLEGDEEEEDDEGELLGHRSLLSSKALDNNNHPFPDSALLENWNSKNLPKNFPLLSPSEAAKMYGVDPETYQQQMMQLQLTSAAMMGDPGGLLKAIGNYPPWVYLGYYSQLLQSFQAQEILRQYAIQSQSLNPTTTTICQDEKQSPGAPRTLGSSGYNCRSPVSPASFSEEPNGGDSDGSLTGQLTPGSANGKRAPRAMTGRHVRTGTGASPSTLQTLRQKIEERQRLKAQQGRPGSNSQGNPKSNSKANHTISNNNITTLLNNNNNNSSGRVGGKKSSKK